MKKIIINLLLLTLIITGCSYNNSQNRVITTNNIINDNSLKNNTKTRDNNSDKKIINEVKNYILNGQNDKPESNKFNWSKSFLDNVNLEKLYEQYISNGGKSDSMENFAQYITTNAPIQKNWKQLFEKDFSSMYNEKIVKIEPLNGDLYQVYILADNKTVPYVVVNSRTGYFHG